MLNKPRYFRGFLVSLVLLGIGELTGFLIVLVANFGNDVDTDKSTGVMIDDDK